MSKYTVIMRYGATITEREASSKKEIREIISDIVRGAVPRGDHVRYSIVRGNEEIASGRVTLWHDRLSFADGSTI